MRVGVGSVCRMDGGVDEATLAQQALGGTGASSDMDCAFSSASMDKWALQEVNIFHFAIMVSSSYLQNLT